MNSLSIAGRATKDPEMRTTSTGNAMCTFCIAENGSWKNETVFVNVAAYGKQAEVCGKYVKKGDVVAVAGPVRLNRYGEGNSKAALAMDVRTVSFFGKRNAASADEAGEAPSQEKETSGYTEIDDEDMPF